MSAASSFRSMIPLAVGLVVGGFGVNLFRGSLPGAEGSPQQRIEQLESELKGVKNELSAYQATGGRPRPGRTLGDGLKGLAEDIRAGRPVTPDDIFRTMQPIFRDLSPLFERMRVRDAQRRADSLAGEYARKYHLNAAQQESLKDWFKQKAESDAKDWSAMVSRDSTTLQDLEKESRNVRPDQGLDSFMEKTLSGDSLTQFKAERLTERSERIQNEADMRVERINSIVPLDDAQRDKMFGIMARGSADYDPSIQMQGGDGQPMDPNGPTGDEAAMAVLTPDQRAAYQAEKDRRRSEAAKDMEAIGLTLPANWDPLDR